MELRVKQPFWPVNLLFVFGAMLLLARAADAFIEGALLPLPTGGRPHARARQVGDPPVALDVGRLRRLTGLALRETPEPAAPTFDPTAPPVRSPLRVRVLGTLLAGLPEYSMASLQDCVTLRSQTLRIGDQVQSAEALDIERARVIVLHNGRREFLDATCGEVASPPSAGAARGSATDGAPPPVALGTTITEIRSNEYAVPRPELEKILANLSIVAMEARIVPAFTDGVARGFKVFSIRPDSLYTRLGIQNGDVIRRINGFELNSPENGLEIYSKLRDSSRIDVEVDRGGSLVRKRYEVR